MGDPSAAKSTPSRAPLSVRTVRALLYLTAALSLLLLATVIAAGSSAQEVGGVAMVPLCYGIAGLVLALLIAPGKRGLRVWILIVEGSWALLSLGTIAQGLPTGIASLVLSTAVLILMSTRAARAYFRSGDPAVSRY